MVDNFCLCPQGPCFSDLGDKKVDSFQSCPKVYMPLVSSTSEATDHFRGLEGAPLPWALLRGCLTSPLPSGSPVGSAIGKPGEEEEHGRAPPSLQWLPPTPGPRHCLRRRSHPGQLPEEAGASAASPVRVPMERPWVPHRARVLRAQRACHSVGPSPTSRKAGSQSC